MLIEIHMIQNHSPANLNRDDLGAPKTCYFGGVLRSRVSSQCLKRSIRLSPQFERLLGGIRTRQLARLIADQVEGDKSATKKRAALALDKCGIKAKEDGKSDMLVYVSREAIPAMAAIVQDERIGDDALAAKIGELIAREVAVPDMALSGRMLETGILTDTTVEAALQVAHAFSTHEARLEVDYYVAADDVPGTDAGAGYVDEGLYASACLYKYFSIDWASLVRNLKGSEELAAHTVGAFIRGAALTNPTGKQNSFAAHNLPDGILVELKDTSISYANAFASPASEGERDIISQSVSQMGQYAFDLDTGYGKPRERFWFSPNLRHRLTVVHDGSEADLSENNLKSLDELVQAVIAAIGLDWEAVQHVTPSSEVNR